MIVKVQVPLYTNDPAHPALIYPRDREWIITLARDEMPDAIWKEAAITGKAYFEATFEDGKVAFGKQVPLPNW